MVSTMDTHGLGDENLLMKIDKLFACGVGEHVDLPQIVAVGDQSSGKSSILEALTGKAFPRDSGLCTRFATQFIFRRANEDRISISIIADPGATTEHRKNVEAWRKSDIDTLDSTTFENIMIEVHDIMGVSKIGDASGEKPTFSNDVLQLEISGPNQEHLSVIDVPGIFKNTTPGMTTKGDIALVKEMVLGYMRNTRSVMLAVIPANVDIATQEILEFAKEVDPAGKRTLGVLTKPDLVDQGAETKIMDLVHGRANFMKLGWHVVRNPGQQQLIEKSTTRAEVEADFFRSKAPWNSLDAEQVGTEALRARVKEVLSNLVNQEFPKVKREVTSRLADAQVHMHKLGPERKTTSDQAAYLTELSAGFQQIVLQMRQGILVSSELFERKRRLRLVPAVLERASIFNKDLARFGQEYAFDYGQSHGKRDASQMESDTEEDPPFDETTTQPHVRVLEGAPKHQKHDIKSVRPPGGVPPLPKNLQLPLIVGTSSSSGTRNNSVETVARHQSHDLSGFPVRKEADEFKDLEGILSDQKFLQMPKPNQIMHWLSNEYKICRGFELGTFAAPILERVMNKQTEKWRSISHGFVSDIIVEVHSFIVAALETVCYDNRMFDALLDALVDGLRSYYEKSMQHVDFLLEIEREEPPMTNNHYFNDNLEKVRQRRLRSTLEQSGIYDDRNKDYVVRVNSTFSVPAMSNSEHTVQDIHDILHAYYKVARKRFVDNVTQQVMGHHLVNGKDTPLTLFSAKFVNGLNSAQLERIVGEPPDMKRERARVAKEIASLMEAKKILMNS